MSSDHVDFCLLRFLHSTGLKYLKKQNDGLKTATAVLSYNCSSHSSNQRLRYLGIFSAVNLVLEIP